MAAGNFFSNGSVEVKPIARYDVIKMLVAMAFGSFLTLSYKSGDEFIDHKINSEAKATVKNHTAPADWGISATGAGKSQVEERWDGKLSSYNSAPYDTKQAVKEFLAPASQPDPIEAVINGVRKDESFRKAIIHDYFRSKDPTVEMKLRFVLSEAHVPDAYEQAKTYLKQANAEQRIKAINMIASIQAGMPAARENLLQMLNSEADPMVLSHVISGVRPLDTRDPQEVATVVKRLQELRENPNSQIRSAALLSLAQWEGPSAIEPDIVAALQSNEPDMMAASMQIVINTQLRSEKLKQVLFETAGRQSVPEQIRYGAIGVLSSYNLNQEDYERLMQMRNASFFSSNHAS